MKKMQSSRRKARGFTLIELLTVISIIGVLAAMLMPAIGAAKKKAQTAVAKKDMSVLIGAINLYNSTYNRMPASSAVRASLTPECPDFTYGTALDPTLSKTLGDKNGFPLPKVGNMSKDVIEANNSEIITILHDWERFPATGSPTVNLNHAMNPQKQDFLDGFKDLDFQRNNPPLYKPGGIGPDGVLRDPWGNPYIITLDLNYDGKCRDGFYRRQEITADIGDLGLNGLRRTRPGNYFELNGTAMVWSIGPDGRVALNKRGSVGENKDNVLSWK